jgi:hypothetical protein
MALGAVWIRLPLVPLSAIVSSQSQRYMPIPKDSQRLSARRVGGFYFQIQGTFILQV